MSKKLVLVGAGGHAISVLDCVDRTIYTDIVITDRPESIGKKVLDLVVTHTDDQLPELFNQGYTDAFVSVGSILDTDLRRKLTEKLLRIGFTLPNIIAQSAVVSSSATLSQGIFIAKGVIVNAEAIVHEGVILNSGCIIEHQCEVGAFCHVSVGAVLCGEVRLGNGVHVGANSVIKQQISVGSHTVIGMGSVVTHDLSANVIAYGNPCKEVRSL